MDLTPLRAFLRRHRRIALDTSVFIYQLEANARYSGFTDPVFAWVEHKDHHAVTSTITMTELLVPAYRGRGEQQVDEFYGLLATYPNLDWIPPDLGIADIATRLCAFHRLRTPDALQAATALHEGATGFIGNDSVFRGVGGIEVLVLEDLL